MTNAQWERSVQYLLQLDGPTGELSGLADVVRGAREFANNEAGLEIDPTLKTDFQVAAESLAKQVAQDPAALSKIYSGTDAAGFIASFGRRAYSRPLSAEETARLSEVFDTGASLSGGGSSEFARGAGLVIEAILQSPGFLYRTELSDAGSRLNGYEVAEKLSLVLRDVIPDDALLDAAESGQLDDDSGIMTVAQQMLDSPDATAVMREYHGELFAFSRYAALEKDQDSVPEFKPEMKAELEEAAHLFLDGVFENGMGLREILTSTKGYANSTLAEFYGDDVSVSGSGFREVELGPNRPGFFTQLPFLIVNSVNRIPDSIHRGVALNLQLLCADVPSPPNVPADQIVLPPYKEGQTNRERVTAGTGPGTCGAGCHSSYINPLGFGFENYDGLGKWRDEEEGKQVDASGIYPFTDGTAEFDGPADLMNKIANGTQAHDCYAKHMAGFVLQRDLTERDRELVKMLSSSSSGASGSIKEMLLAVVTDPAFTTRAVGGAQ